MGERQRETLEEVEVEMGRQPDFVYMICLEELQRAIVEYMKGHFAGNGLSLSGITTPLR